MQRKGANISLKGYDDIFSTEQSRAESQQERVQEIPLSELHPFEGHPFRVVDDEEMMKTAESVRDFGVLTPAIVRPDPDGGYEIVSGHRRHRASELAGKENIIRLDNALSSIPEKLEKAHEQLTNLQNQQEATRAELGKPFPQEAELAEKSARLAELDAALNMEDSMPEREEAEQADKPSVLADLKAKSEHIPPYRASGGREEVL